MKKSFCTYILIFLNILAAVSIISCKNTSETKLAYTESDTIKKSVKEKEHGITWTQELEAERLSEPISRSSMELGFDVLYSKDLFKISKQKQKAVYPELSDFGSLDTRNLRPSVKEKLNNFCTSLSSENHSGADAFFSRKYIFNYVFFVNDLEKGWKTNFGTDYPKNTAVEQTEQTNSDEFTTFIKWTFGEPFVGSEIIQIPVRFYATCGIIDVTVFLNSNGNNEIYQITIDRWKKV